MIKDSARKTANFFMSIKPWYFLAFFAISAVVCVFALRQNNFHMVQLRNAVYAADKSDGNVQSALKNLQAYVVSHMNTSLSAGTTVYPPVQLQYTYQRLQATALKKLGYSDFYTKAQDYCQAKFPAQTSLFVWQSYVACVQDYLSSHNLNLKVEAYTPPAALYEFNFISPKWSPDLAGWSLLVSLVFLALFIVAAITSKLRLTQV